MCLHARVRARTHTHTAGAGAYFRELSSDCGAGKSVACGPAAGWTQRDVVLSEGHLFLGPWET